MENNVVKLSEATALALSVLEASRKTNNLVAETLYKLYGNEEGDAAFTEYLEAVEAQTQYITSLIGKCVETATEFSDSEEI